MESIEITSTCCWCGRTLIEHRPRQDSDPALVRQMNDTVICHSCVKHLAVIVLNQECQTEREQQQKEAKDDTRTSNSAYWTAVSSR